MKVLDFGLARYKAFDPAMRMSNYVVTRYYRAPEIIFEIPYDLKGFSLSPSKNSLPLVDVWSIGCIFAELLLHRVLLQGRSSMDQWAKIVGALGSPSEDFLRLLPPHLAAYKCDRLIEHCMFRFLNNMPVVPQRDVREIITDNAFVQRSEISPNLTGTLNRYSL